MKIEVRASRPVNLGSQWLCPAAEGCITGLGARCSLHNRWDDIQRRVAHERKRAQRREELLNKSYTEVATRPGLLALARTLRSSTFCALRNHHWPRTKLLSTQSGWRPDLICCLVTLRGLQTDESVYLDIGGTEFLRGENEKLAQANRDMEGLLAGMQEVRVDSPPNPIFPPTDP